MDRFDENFRFFRDAIESVPGEIDTVKPSSPQSLSRNDLQQKLEAKMSEAKAKKQKPEEKKFNLKDPKIT